MLVLTREQSMLPYNLLERDLIYGIRTPWRPSRESEHNSSRRRLNVFFPHCICVYTRKESFTLDPPEEGIELVAPILLMFVT
jgi:hypothetical protein